MKKASRRYFSAVEDWWEHAGKSNALMEAVGAYIFYHIYFYWTSESIKKGNCPFHGFLEVLGTHSLAEQQCFLGIEPPLTVTVHHF